MNLNPAGFSKSDMSSSWEEVNPAGFSKSDMSSSWEEVRSALGVENDDRISAAIASYFSKTRQSLRVSKL